MIAESHFSPFEAGQVVLGTDPAANTEISETVPAGEIWRLLAVSVALVQGATQTPQPILSISDGTTTFYESLGSTAAQSASTTCRYTWAPGLVVSGQVGATTNVHSVAPLPEDMLLLPGYVIATVTVGKGANSDYGQPAFFVVKGKA